MIRARPPHRPPRTNIPWVRSDFHDCADKRSPRKSLRIRADGYAKCFRCGWQGWMDGRATDHELEAARARERRYPRIIDKVISECVPLTPDCAAGRYLRSRKLVDPWSADPGWPNDLRFHPALRHSPSDQKFPAMVALLRSGSGKLLAIHRTYLTAGGKKAPVEPVRMVLGTLAGAGFHAPALPARTPDGALVYRGSKSQPRTTICVCEGIEDALALRLFYAGYAAWAAISASTMERTEPPDDYSHVKIFGDDDKVGRRAAKILYDRLLSDGWLCSLEIPDGFKDPAEAWYALGGVE